MKAIFFVQDFAFNKKINYHTVAKTVKDKFYLISYHATQEQLDQYIQEHYPDGTFVETFAQETLDVNMIKLIIANYVIKQGNDILIITNSESAVSICGLLRKDFGISDDNMLRYVDKIVMKQALNDDVNVPKYMKFSNEAYLKNPTNYLNKIAETLGIPFFVKPTNQFSSKGTMQINELEDFKNWHQRYYNQEEHVEIDEVVSGTLYHCDSFIKDGKILYTQVCEYLYPCYDFILGKPLGSFTLPKESDDFKIMDKYNTHVLKQLGLPQGGLTHLEVFKRHNGELIFLEVAARPAGAQVPIVYQKALNISIREAHILLQIDPNYNPDLRQSMYCGFVSYPKKLGIVSFLNIPFIKSEYTIHWDIKIGDQLVDPDKISDVAGSIVLWNNHFDQLKEDLNYLKKFDAFIVTTH